MTPQESEKLQVRVNCLNTAITLNQQRIVKDSSADSATIISDAQAIYDFVTQDMSNEQPSKLLSIKDKVVN